MKNRSLALGLAACALGLAIGGEPAPADDAASGTIPSGVDVFAARCAVCHGPEAAGIPGSFPSLREQIVAFAKTPQGRDYLVMVVTTGLAGNLQVGGVAYRGVMPAQSGLSEAEVAAVLTYLAGDRGKNAAALRLTAADVTAARARHAAGSPQSTRAMRPAFPDSETLPGVTNLQRAWQNWTLSCQGCHRPDGTGSAGTAPSLKGTVAKFLTVAGGREYLGRVPGVSTSPLSNADLAEVMNWMFRRFDAEHVPAEFKPFTAEEIGRLRTRPLRLEASQMRARLLSESGG